MLSVWQLLPVALIFLAASVIFFILAKKRSPYRGIYKRILSLASYNAVIALIFTFLNYEEVVLLCNRFWYAIWIIEIIVWGYMIYKRFRPAKEAGARQAKDKAFKKYLP
jgi:hypothetical protein